MSENTATAATPEADDTVTAQAGAVSGDAVAPAGDAASVGGAAPAGDAASADGAAAPAGDAASVGGVSKAMIADIEEAMKDVVDPELGINVVDLGLVYGVHVDDENVATLDMTLTSAACPLTDVIEDQARQALTTGPGGGLVNDIRINWVWLPPWGPDKITDEGRDQLRSLGFNV
ncbi:metal-sulfur cluster assembly factor [Micromonospora sp. CA-249363]|uniref:metal-sulfur cluster assembly factor n=1 Tax=Micromonospora sp. CA-249363 TaxID=3239963 RepID=UPI003D8DDFF5